MALVPCVGQGHRRLLGCGRGVGGLGGAGLWGCGLGGDGCGRGVGRGWFGVAVVLVVGCGGCFTVLGCGCGCGAFGVGEVADVVEALAHGAPVVDGGAAVVFEVGDVGAVVGHLGDAGAVVGEGAAVGVFDDLCGVFPEVQGHVHGDGLGDEVAESVEAGLGFGVDGAAAVGEDGLVGGLFVGGDEFADDADGVGGEVAFDVGVVDEGEDGGGLFGGGAQ